MYDSFPHKRDGHAIRFLHSRRISSPKGLHDRFLATLQGRCTYLFIYRSFLVPKHDQSTYSIYKGQSARESLRVIS
jgi:hypothetical protein